MQSGNVFHFVAACYLATEFLYFWISAHVQKHFIRIGDGQSLFNQAMLNQNAMIRRYCQRRWMGLRSALVCQRACLVLGVSLHYADTFSQCGHFFGAHSAHLLLGHGRTTEVRHSLRCNGPRCPKAISTTLCVFRSRDCRVPVPTFHPLGSRDRAQFEKLATAAASVSQTSNTVSSLVICRTSWNSLPRWHRRSDAPWVFALQCAATNVPSPELSIYLMLSMFRTICFFPSAIRLFNFSRRALLSSPSTMRPSSATTDTPFTSRFVIFKATFVSSSSTSSPAATNSGTGRRTNNDRHSKCNLYIRLGCSATASCQS